MAVYGNGSNRAVYCIVAVFKGICKFGLLGKIVFGVGDFNR